MRFILNEWCVATQEIPRGVAASLKLISITSPTGAITSLRVWAESVRLILNAWRVAAARESPLGFAASMKLVTNYTQGAARRVPRVGGGGGEGGSRGDVETIPDHLFNRRDYQLVCLGRVCEALACFRG